jgi:hypothetical protein
MLKQFGLATAMVATVAVCSVPASAAVRYDFKALTSFDEPPLGKITGSFSLVSPDFLQGITMIGGPGLSDCSFNSTIGPVTCDSIEFLHQPPSEDGVEIFGHVSGQSGEYGYFFDSTAFATPGVHDSIFFGDFQHGVLTVTVLPEPAIWTTMLLGFGGLGAMMRRRQRAIGMS